MLKAAIALTMRLLTHSNFMREALRKVKVPHAITHEDSDKQCKEMTIKARQLAVESNKTYLGRKGLSKLPYDRKEPSKTDRTDTVAADTTDTTDAAAAADPADTEKPARRRGMPPKGKDIHEYAHERREAYHQRIDGKCSHCAFGPHNARDCYYLTEDLEDGWHASPKVWAYSLAIKASSKNTTA